MQAVLFVLLAVSVLAGAGWALAYRPDLAPATLEREYAEGASRFVEVDGLRFHYQDEGEGAPIVLLHGLTANLFVWDPWATRLSEYFRVIRLDLPGHGLTGPDPEERYDWPRIADLVLQLLDRLGVARATLAGNSFGGAIAWQIAARHPERVGRLILVAPVGYTAGEQLPPLLRLLAHPVTGPLLARLTPWGAFMKRLRQTHANPASVDPEQAERQYRLFRRAGNRDALGAILRGGETLETEPLLARIQVPTLILWGATDPVLPSSNAQRFARDIDDAEVVVIRGAGHAPMLEQPDSSAAKLLDFLGVSHGHRPAEIRPTGRAPQRPQSGPASG